MNRALLLSYTVVRWGRLLLRLMQNYSDNLFIMIASVSFIYLDAT